MRLDKRITALGLTRAQAKRLIARGEVRVNGEVERDAGRIVTDADEVRAQGTADDPAMDVAWPIRAHGGIQGVTIYSEDEQATGGTWIDGRPIYRKTVSGEMTSSNAFIQIGQMPTGYAQVVRMYGTISFGTQTLLIPNAFYQNLAYMVTPVVDGQTISLALGSGFGSSLKRYALSIEYTKNTD